jgi:hypothetical protein
MQELSGSGTVTGLAREGVLFVLVFGESDYLEVTVHCWEISDGCDA